MFRIGGTLVKYCRSRRPLPRPWKARAPRARAPTGMPGTTWAIVHQFLRVTTPAGYGRASPFSSRRNDTLLDRTSLFLRCLRNALHPASSSSKRSIDMTLIESLQRAPDRVLLRVVDSPGAGVVHEFTGKHLLDSEKLARLQPIFGDSRVVLLLLPHSPELFLLQIGLTLCGKVPAVLPWPTTRVDGLKYQRNLLHQLNQLPADHLITLPRLAKNLQPGVGFPVSGCELENSGSPRRYTISPILGGYDGNTEVRRGNGRDACGAGVSSFGSISTG
jgi:hypothetical protein